MAGPFSEVLWLHAPGGLTDLSGNGNNGSFVGGASISGNKYVLSSSGDGITIADANSLDVSPAMTISLWIRMDVQASKQIFSKWTGSPSWNFQTQATSRPQFQYTSDGTGGTFGQWTASATPTLTGSLRHIVVASNAGVSKFYINGTLTATTAPTLRTTFFSGTAAISIGIETTSFTGDVADVRVIPSELNSTQVLTLYNAGVPGYGYSATSPVRRRTAAQASTRSTL